MKNYVAKDTFIKTRNMVATSLKEDFLQFLQEKYGEAAIAFKSDGRTKEIVFKAGEVTDEDGNFPVDIYASIDLHVKNYCDIKQSGKEIPPYDFEAEVDNYNITISLKEAEKAKKAAARQAKAISDKVKVAAETE